MMQAWADYLDSFKRGAEITSSVFRCIKAKSEEATTLAAFRDTLLPRLVSGKLRINDARSQTEAAPA